jgi:cob(I)alamin adenosyltransferase
VRAALKIYTKTGDKGETGLIGGRRVRKNEPHVEAYGDVDELNAALGAVEAPALSSQLTAVQKELFVVGAILAGQKGAQAPAPERLEREIDRMSAELPELRHFILPRGPLHLARTICRRAERAVVALPDAPAEVIVYLNRLSDWLFVAARWLNAKNATPETIWEGL